MTWTESDHGALLNDLDGVPRIRLTCGGDAVLLDEGRVVDLAEAEEIWIDGDGDEHVFSEARSFALSLH